MEDASVVWDETKRRKKASELRFEMVLEIKTILYMYIHIESLEFLIHSILTR